MSIVHFFLRDGFLQTGDLTPVVAGNGTNHL